jgi:type IX secretion system PorP/SprF family membrane protein
LDFLKKNAFVGDIFEVIIKKIISVFLLIAAILSPLFSVKAQDASFSQYYASSLYLNPAFAGMESRTTFSSNYRTQWKSIVVPYVTSQASLIVPIRINKGEKHLGGVGLSFYNNNAGDGNFKTLGVNLNIGYIAYLSSMHALAFGAQGGYVQKSVDLQSFQWGSQFNPLIGGYDPSVPVNINSIAGQSSFTDFAGGLMYHFNPERDYEESPVSIYIGGAGYHLSQPNESMLKDSSNKLPMLIKSHAGLEWNISEKFNFSPNVYMAMQNKSRQINAGAYFTFMFGSGESAIAPSKVLLGGWYRLNDSFIFTTGIGSPNYTLGFSYDLNNSSLRYNTQGRGAYELSLKVYFGSTKKVIIYNPLI